VYADPSGGLHRQAVSVKLVANKVCKVEWSVDGVKEWKVYDGKPISVSKPTTIYYKAVDSCGKKMDVRSKRYEFEMAASRCPTGMEIISVGGKEFCVDIYEWPNKKGAMPQPYVSLYQAMDSCFSVRKRLCTTEEWTTACGGPEKWKYLYGENYEWNTCVTRDTAVLRSGSRPECRGYYGVFDMSGNLAEWTSTPAPQDRSFNNVMGGFWASGSQSRCADARYSYFPQNRHNPVGFRCCADAPPETRPKGR
jgi:formylglycine-generating enzyme required for sulfatase activity